MAYNMTAKVTIFTLLTVVTAFFSGCTTPVAIDPVSGSEQTAYYQAGYFVAPVDQPPVSVFKTAIREIDAMGYYRTGELHKDASITIYARKVGDEKVTVRITPLDPGTSQLRIRVGSLGDLAESQVIYAKIRDAL